MINIVLSEEFLQASVTVKEAKKCSQQQNSTLQNRNSKSWANFLAQ